MNVHESEKIAGQLEKLGYSETAEVEKADIVVFNTCTIRENAVHKAYGNIGKLKTYRQENKKVIIAVGGCMTQDKELPKCPSEYYVRLQQLLYLLHSTIRSWP